MQAMSRFAILLSAGFLAGCTELSLAVARHRIAAGNPAAAHQYFAAALNSNRLSPGERRQAMDGLCRAEYALGAPTYSLMRQVRTCAVAAQQPGSRSGPVLAQLEPKARTALTATITTALAQHDIARAEDGILQYRALPDSDSGATAGWTRQLWMLVDRETQPAPGARSITPAIARLSRQFIWLRGLNERQFRNWVEKNITVSGTPLVSITGMSRRTLQLRLGDDQLANAALNLDRFARVNNGLVARCHCAGRTEVALKDSGLPAYLVRLDPASSQSEVLILDQR